MARRFRWILLLVVLLATGWYIWSPRRAWDRFLTALVTGDEQLLSATVDFPTVRENLREDLRTALAAAPGSSGNLSTAVLGVLTDQVVNVAVTPQGLSDLLAGLATAQPGADTKDGIITQTARFRYRGPSRVDIAVGTSDAPDDAKGILTFSRSGLSWRLTRVWSDRLTTHGESP
jgi:hypothetical protein